MKLISTRNGLADKYKNEMLKSKKKNKAPDNAVLSTHKVSTDENSDTQETYYADMNGTQLEKSIMALRYEHFGRKKQKKSIFKRISNFIFYIFSFVALMIGLLFLCNQYNPELFQEFYVSLMDIIEKLIHMIAN